MTRILGILFSLFLLAPAAWGDEKEAEELFERFVPPCCYTGLLRDHQSGAAEEMKDEIRALLSEGKTEQEIIDHFVARYGERILSQPPSQGFNRLAVLAPAGALIAGFLIVVLLIRAQRRRAVEALPAEEPGIDPVIDSEIEREIREGTE